MNCLERKIYFQADWTSVDCILRAWPYLPDKLAESNWQNPSDTMHTAMQSGLRMEMHGFEWFAKHPNILQDFNVFMTHQREGRSYWLDWYPFEQKFCDSTADSVLFVDVGGAFGSEITQICKRFPKVEGNLILQDLPQTIEMVPPDAVFEPMVHNFMTPNPVKGQSSAS